MNLAGSSTEFVVILLLLSMVVFAACTVIVKDLLKSAIALGVTSAILSIAMFLMNSYLAAVFELSVCAGMITAVFISVISLTKPRTHEEMTLSKKQRTKRFIYLPFLLLIIGALLFSLRPNININYASHPVGTEPTVQLILWKIRKADMIGQIAGVLAGVFGVVILFKGRDVE